MQAQRLGRQLGSAGWTQVGRGSASTAKAGASRSSDPQFTLPATARGHLLVLRGRLLPVPLRSSAASCLLS